MPTVHLFIHLKSKNMSTKFAIIGIVSVLGTGAIMHHARFCPLQKMMAAMHQHKTQTVAMKAPAATTAAATAAMVVMK